MKIRNVVSIIICIFNLLSISFAQKYTYTKQQIEELIQKRSPLFLTGNTSINNMGGNDQTMFKDFMPGMKNIPIQELNPSNAYGSIVMIYQGELLKTPLNMKMAVYPISTFDDSMIVCTRKPKSGAMYSNVESYDINDIVLVSTAAFKNGEISELPTEMTADFIKNLIYSTKNSLKFADPEITKCLLLDQLNNYLWINEFVKQEFLQAFQNKLNQSLQAKKDLLSPSEPVSFYIDIQVKFDEYSFDKKSFPIYFGNIISVSPSLKKHPYDIEISFNMIPIDGDNLEIKKNQFNTTIFDVDEYLSYGYRNEVSNKEYQWNDEEHWLNATPDQARSIVNNLEDERVLKLRLFLEPNKLASLSSIACRNNQLELSTIPFTLKNYSFLK